MKLRLQYPRSFEALLLIAFALVALPLLGGMLNTAFLLETIVDEGSRSVATTVEVTRATRQLVEGVSAIQRAAVQFQVLGDENLLSPVADAHRRMEQSIWILRAMPLDAGQRNRLEALASAEASLFQRVNIRGNDWERRMTELSPRFDQLHDLASAVAAEGHAVIERRTASMRETARAARKSLFVQAAAMVPLSLLLAALFAWLINRPVGQLARAIRRLGENDLAPGPEIDGPQDLVYLGEHVDWLRRHLIELEEQKVHFLRHVSHELKTPLAAVREGVELLADKVGGELTAEQDEITRILRDNARDLQRRIDDLIRYSRLVQQPDAPVLAPLALEEVLAEVLKRHELTARAKGLNLRPALNGIRLMGDREKLATVLNNLLSNAIRYSPAAGTVEVAGRVVDGQVEIRVCDQGPGVPEGERRHLFRPFFQGSVQPAGSVRGTGLGLAIVKEYVEAHDGRVDLVDQAPWGACFRVTLPTAEGGGK